MSASLVMLSMKHKTIHAATVQAFSIGSQLTTLPVNGQNGFDMAFNAATILNPNQTQTETLSILTCSLIQISCQ